AANLGESSFHAAVFGGAQPYCVGGCWGPIQPRDRLQLKPSADHGQQVATALRFPESGRAAGRPALRSSGQARGGGLAKGTAPRLPATEVSEPLERAHAGPRDEPAEHVPCMACWWLPACNLI